MSLVSALNPIGGSARAWLIPVVMFAWLFVMGATLGTLHGVFKFGERYGRTDEQRIGLAAELVRADESALSTTTFTRQANDAVAQAAKVAQQAQASQRRVQEDFNAYVKANPNPDCRLPAGYARVWNSANAQAHPTSDAGAAADTDGGLSATAAAGQRRAEHASGEPLGGDTALPNLRRRPAGADSVDQGAGSVP